MTRENKMNDENYWLLTDEFIAFSDKIKSIHERKKTKKAELKAFYDKIQNEIKSLEEEAKLAEEAFQKWKKSVEDKPE